jgi:excisionase family DNA binding protein
VITSEWLNVRQVAQLLGVDEKTVTRWSRSDPSMPVLRRGRIVRFNRAGLSAWLEQQLPRKARASAQHTSSHTHLKQPAGSGGHGSSTGSNETVYDATGEVLSVHRFSLGEQSA